MIKQRDDSLPRKVGPYNRYKPRKMADQGRIVRGEKHFKCNFNFRNSYKRYLKGSKSKMYYMKMAFPHKKQEWAIRDMAMEIPTSQKGMPFSHSIIGDWKVEDVIPDERPNKNGATIDFDADEACELLSKGISNDGVNSDVSRILKINSSSVYSRVGGEKYLKPFFGFTNGREHRALRGCLKQSVESSCEPAEFHHISGKRYLLILRYPSRIHFRGALSVTPIIGSTSFLGYEFFPGMQSRLVFSPKGTSPLYLQALGCLNDGNVEEMAKIPGVDKSIVNRIGLRDSAILIEPASGEYWERLFGSFASTLNFNPLLPNTRVKSHAHSELNVERNLGVEFVQPGESVVTCRLHDENSEWDKLSEEMVNSFENQGPFRFMVFGGKGVGKSTFMRFMVNQWLSNCRRRKKSGLHNINKGSALFVDFDPGQSEFMPPGCISATLVSEPLLGPNYTHFKVPERMICIGDLNVERCPDWYLKCADELLKFCYSNPELCQIPWFINTMGFCRGIGGDLAVKLVQLCHPTHVIQMRSRFSRRNFEPPGLLSRNSVNFWKGMDWNPSISSQKGNQVSEYFYHQLWSLAERSSVEEDILNGVQGTTENGARAAPIQDSGEMEDIDSEWGLPAWQSRDLCIVAYFSQMVSGPKYSVLQSTPHMIALSDLILSLPSPLLKPQMITTTFNARLVALCNFKNSQESTVLSKNYKSEEQLCGIPDELMAERKKLPWETVLRPNTSQHPKVLFHMPLSPCLGFGIVRAIDKNNHRLFLTTPVKDEDLMSVNCLATSPSMGSLPKEIYFEPLRLDPKRKDPIPYTVICDKKNIFSRTIPRVFHMPSKFLSTNKA